MALPATPPADLPFATVRAWVIGHSTTASVSPLLQRWGCDVSAYPSMAAATAQAAIAAAPQLILVEGRPADAPLLDALLALWDKKPGVIWLSDEAETDTAHAMARGWSVLQPPARPAALRALVGQLLLRQP